MINIQAVRISNVIELETFAFRDCPFLRGRYPLLDNTARSRGV